METAVPEIAAELASLYGTSELPRAGVLHVTAVMRAVDGRLRVLKIGEQPPKSATDYFVLNLCRARADAVLTSAANLREEADLVVSIAGPHAAPLTRYRHETLCKPGLPVCVLLTRGGELPLEHPLWSDGTDKLVLTTPAARAELTARLGARAEVVGLDGLDARTATAWLHARGLSLVSIEAGPSTVEALYQAPVLVSELLLSIYEGPADGVALGGALPADAALFVDARLVAETVRAEESGRWRFQRWLR